jgi:hypothetical protein
MTRPKLLSLHALRWRRHPPAATDHRIEHVVALPGGYAVAVYACRCAGSRLFVGYAKAFRGDVASYWQAPGCFAKFSSEGEHECAETAVADALGVALMSLMNIGCLRAEARAPGPRCVASWPP